MCPDAQVGRSKGFDEEIAKYPNFKVVASQTGNFTGAEGQAVMESFLKSVDKIDVLWAENDNMALGAIEAIKAAGLEPGKAIERRRTRLGTPGNDGAGRSGLVCVGFLRGDEPGAEEQ